MVEATEAASANRAADTGGVDSSRIVAASRRSPVIPVALCFLAVLLDGLDTSSIGVAGPAIAAQFEVGMASLTAPFVMTSVGAVIGYILSGSLVSRWNAPRVLSVSAVAFGVLSLATPHAGSITQLALLRLLTAIGLGTALPSAISIAVLQSPTRLREATAAIVATGLAAGGILGSTLGSIITRRYGWEYLFYIGGMLPILLSFCLWRWLPNAPSGSRSVPASDLKRADLVKQLLSHAHAAETICLWTVSFLIFADSYALLFWLPPLLIQLGQSAESAQLGIGVFSAGGVFANVCLVLLMSRISAIRVMLAAATLAALSVLGLFLSILPPGAMWVLVAGAGGLIACNVGQAVLAVSIYPPALRTNGIGFSAAAGRLGSIAGPAMVGFLFALGWPPRWILLATSAPIMVAVSVLVFLARRARRMEPNACSSVSTDELGNGEKGAI